MYARPGYESIVFALDMLLVLLGHDLVCFGLLWIAEVLGDDSVRDCDGDDGFFLLAPRTLFDCFVSVGVNYVVRIKLMN